MNIKINTIKVSSNEILEKYVEDKIKKLQQINDKIINAEVFLKVENSSEINNKVVEIRIELPGGDFFSKKQSNSFEDAIDQAVEALRKQIQKYKEKLRDL